MIAAVLGEGIAMLATRRREERSDRP